MNESNVFDTSNCTSEKKLANFSKYIRRQTMARFLVQHELFKIQMSVKGSIIECGVHHGGGVMAWAKLSSTLEPYNYHRQIIGFDTFAGFPSVAPVDSVNRSEVKEGMFAEDYNVYEELGQCIKAYDNNRFINDKSKIQLVQGDATLTIPEYVKQNPHILISMLYLDFDIYKPTRIALDTFLPRMPGGALIVFDEVNNPDWPGETQALLEVLGVRKNELKCFEFEPNISYMRV